MPEITWRAMTKRKGSNLLKGKSLQKAKRIAFFWVPATLLIFTIGLLGAAGYITAGNPGEISRGVSLSGLNVGGLSESQAKSKLNSRLDEIRLIYQVEGRKLEIGRKSEHDGAALLTFDAETAVKDALAVGKQGGRWQLYIDRLVMAFNGKNIPVPFTLNEPGLMSLMESELASKLPKAEDARLDLSVDELTGRIDAVAVPETVGKTLTVSDAMNETGHRLSELSGGVINLKTIDDVPEVKLDDVKPFASEAAAVAGRAPLTLRAKGNFWTVSRSLAASWIKVKKRDDGAGFRLGLDDEAVSKYLNSRSEVLFVKPVDAIFEIDEKSGRVTRIVPSINGEGLDVEGSVAIMEESLFDPSHGKYVDLALKAVEPDIPTEKSNPWGVKEIIGEGSSYFAGSPANRRHNISVGVATLSGLVIPPDSVFSTMGSLGEIDGAAGYRQELVIKDNKTIPEYGGGLCQIGSTVFRAALASGLPVTERRNHSYRVSYYEYDGKGRYIGPGKDATIYDPAPDMKFLNDTGHHIVMMTRIQGNSLYFTLWGVNDGRTAEEGPVTVYNKTDPPEKKIVETEDLPPGEEKCTEHPHPGADSVFTYKVTYPDGEVVEKNFYSHYKPWGEVCLVGIDPNAPKIDENIIGAPTTADAAGVTGD